MDTTLPSPSSPAKDVALYDSRGRFLKAVAGSPITCGDGTATEAALLRTMRVSRAEDRFAISFSCGGFARYEPPGSFVLAADAATLFQLHVEDLGDAQKLAFSFELAGNTLYLTSTDDGRVVAGPDACYFTMLVQPVLGTVPAVYAAHSMEGRWVSLWFGLDRGWMCPCPTNLLGGGEVKSRVAKMGDWERFMVRPLDRGNNIVALQSCHGRWLSHAPNGSLTCDKKEVGQWERFTIIQVNAAECALASTAHNGRAQYVNAIHERMDCKATAVGFCERFILMDTTEARRRYNNTNPSFDMKAEQGKLSPWAIAGIVGASLLGAAVIAGGIAGAVIAVHDAQRREQVMREEAERSKAVAAQALEQAEAAKAEAEDANTKLQAESRVREALSKIEDANTSAAAVVAALQRLLHEVEETVAARRAAVDWGGPVYIVQALKRFERAPDVALAGLEAFYALSITSRSNIVMTTPKAVEATARALELHTASPQVVQAALQVIERLAKTENGQEQALACSVPVLVLKALRTSLDTADDDTLLLAVQASLAVLYSYTKQDSVARGMLGSNGAAVVTELVRRQHMSLDVLEYGLQLARDMMTHTAPAELVQRFHSAGLIPVLVAQLSSHQDDEQVVYWIVRLLSTCSQRYVGQTVQAAVVASGAPRELRRLMPQYQHNTHLCAEWCHFYAGLAEARMATAECQQALPTVQALVEVTPRDASKGEAAAFEDVKSCGKRVLAAMGRPHGQA